MTQPQTVDALCRGILEQPELEPKLAPPRDALDDSAPGPAVHVDAPARTPGLSFSGGAGKLPRPGELGEPSARARCLARFAHHELMAVELFAWALLRWPELPAGLRQSWLRALGEEQDHCRLYLERLAAYGSTLEEHLLSDYFWKHAPRIAASPHGPRAFLAAMGLTLEQANLDFSLLYRDAFRDAGDEESARVCQRVHDEEITHVRLARTWLLRLSPDLPDDLAAYTRAVPFPLGAARAKGRRFEAEARRRAGLGESFIEHVRSARPRRETQPRS